MHAELQGPALREQDSPPRRDCSGLGPSHSGRCGGCGGASCCGCHPSASRSSPPAPSAGGPSLRRAAAGPGDTPAQGDPRGSLVYPVLSLLAATHPEMQGLLIWGENSVIGVDFFFFFALILIL